MKELAHLHLAIGVPALRPTAWQAVNYRYSNFWKTVRVMLHQEAGEQVALAFVEPAAVSMFKCRTILFDRLRGSQREVQPGNNSEKDPCSQRQKPPAGDRLRRNRFAHCTCALKKNFDAGTPAGSCGSISTGRTSGAEYDSTGTEAALPDSLKVIGVHVWRLVEAKSE
ncbi:hypothetical protein SDC9_185884 [bioreactor metagenome]|uniref:Uncharacterized protein n=1 Tax=bioreactor metagenome TaxID=1076179 RepID=A0A645HHZ8_9ZZZZ